MLTVVVPGSTGTPRGGSRDPPLGALGGWSLALDLLQHLVGGLGVGHRLELGHDERV